MSNLIMYRTHGFGIDKVEVSRLTKHFVVFENGRRDAIRSQYYNYFHTFQDAKDFLVELRTSEVEKAKRALEIIEKRLRQVRELEEEQ